MNEHIIAGAKYTKNFIMSSNATILLMVTIPEIITIAHGLIIFSIPIIWDSILSAFFENLIIIIATFLSGVIRYKKKISIPFVVGTSIDSLKVLKNNVNKKYSKIDLDKVDSFLGAKTSLSDSNLFLVKFQKVKDYNPDNIYQIINRTWKKLEVIQEFILGNENTILNIYLDYETPLSVSFALGLFLGKTHQKYIIWDKSEGKMKEVFESRTQTKKNDTTFDLKAKIKTDEIEKKVSSLSQIPKIVDELGIKRPIVFINVTASKTRRDFTIKEAVSDADAWIEIYSSKTGKWLSSEEVGSLCYTVFNKLSDIIEKISEKVHDTIYLALKIPHPVSIALAQRLYHLRNIVILQGTPKEDPYFEAFSIGELLETVPCLKCK